MEKTGFKESQLVNKWLWEKHKTALQGKRVRLGFVNTKKDARYYKTTLRWADAIFLENDIVHIVEAKLQPKLDAIGQLLGYKRLFTQTPEFTQWREKQIKLVYLCPVLDTTVLEECEAHDIDLVIWYPKEWEWWYGKTAQEARN